MPLQGRPFLNVWTAETADIDWPTGFFAPVRDPLPPHPVLYRINVRPKIIHHGFGTSTIEELIDDGRRA